MRGCIHTGLRGKIVFFTAVFSLGSCLSLSWSEQAWGCPVMVLHHTKQDFSDLPRPLNQRPRMITTYKKFSPCVFSVLHNNFCSYEQLATLGAPVKPLTAWTTQGRSPCFFHTLPTHLVLLSLFLLSPLVFVA